MPAREGSYLLFLLLSLLLLSLCPRQYPLCISRIQLYFRFRLQFAADTRCGEMGQHLRHDLKTIMFMTSKANMAWSGAVPSPSVFVCPGACCSLVWHVADDMESRCCS